MCLSHVFHLHLKFAGRYPVKLRLPSCLLVMAHFYRGATLTRLTFGAVSLRYRSPPFAEEHDSVSALFLVESSLRGLNTPGRYILREQRAHIRSVQSPQARGHSQTDHAAKRYWKGCAGLPNPKHFLLILGDQREAIVFGLHCVL